MNGIDGKRHFILWNYHIISAKGNIKRLQTECYYFSSELFEQAENVNTITKKQLSFVKGN